MEIVRTKTNVEGVSIESISTNEKIRFEYNVEKEGQAVTRIAVALYRDDESRSLIGNGYASPNGEAGFYTVGETGLADADKCTLFAAFLKEVDAIFRAPAK